MTDKQLLCKRFASSLRQYDSLAVVQQEIGVQLSEMIDRICTAPVRRALEVGAGTGFLTRLLLKQYPDTEWFVNDIVETAQAFIAPYAEGHSVCYRWGDAETLSLPDRLDLVASASTVQWFEQLPRFLHRVFEVLNPEGYLAFSTFGPQNFLEIKATTQEGLDYYTGEQLSALLRQEGFTLVENLEYTKELYFDTPLEVLRHIKATGVNSIRNTHWVKQQLQRFEQEYLQKFAISTVEGKTVVPLTYHPLLIVAQKEPSVL
ncbi:MAG: malonyl-ACP O-methyltransferase BioC [Alistipes sp.]|nr:malonyl-ACP O-methyltransferase BioC [Alistipes sp.]